MKTVKDLRASAKAIFYPLDPKAPITCGDMAKMFQAFFQMVNDLHSLHLQLPDAEFITPKEFARITGYSDSNSRRMCREGKLKAWQETEGKAWMVHTSEIHRIIHESTENLYNHPSFL